MRNRIIDWIADFPEVIPPEKMLEVSNLGMAQELVRLTIVRHSLGGEYIRNVPDINTVFLRPLPHSEYHELVDALTVLFDRYTISEKLRTEILETLELGFQGDGTSEREVSFCHQALINIDLQFNGYLHHELLQDSTVSAK